MVFWLKLNIYPLLLSALLFSELSLFVFFPSLRHIYFYIPAIVLACAILKFTYDIFCNYCYKRKVYFKMLKSCQKHYDRRIFLHYMGSPCMRHVVFWVLREMKKPFKEYLIIKALAKRKHKDIDYLNYNIASQARRVKVSFHNGKAEFNWLDAK